MLCPNLLLKRRAARYASGINDAGDIVGLLEPVALTRNANHGFLFSGNSLIDMGTLDGDPSSVSVPIAINQARQITGVAWKNFVSGSGPPNADSTSWAASGPCTW